MIILGIDPGYAIVGYGALRFERGQYRAIGFGAITTEAGMDFSARLQYIYDNMMEMIRQCRPDAVAIEALFSYQSENRHPCGGGERNYPIGGSKIRRADF